MLPPRIRKLAAMLVAIPVFVKEATAACDPTTATCPANLGLDSASYFIDFTKQSSLPANWTLANYESVTYGPSGAEFTFAKRHDAPYIWTDFYFLFGTIEVVMQAASGIGIVSSAVLISDDLDEIDWEFSGNNFGLQSGLVQTNYFGKGVTGTYDRGTQVLASFPQTEFHTYTMDWTPTSLIWSIDGAIVRTLPNTGATTGDHQYPQSPMQVHLGLWDAGDADTAAETRDWAGGLTDLTKAPYTAYVKSVRIENATPCGSYRYGDTSGSASSIVCVGGEGETGGNGSGGQAPTPVNENQVLAGSGSSPSNETNPNSSITAAHMAQSGNTTITIIEDDCSCTDAMRSTALIPYPTVTPAVVSYYTAPPVPTAEIASAENFTALTSASASASAIVPAIAPVEYKGAGKRGRNVPTPLKGFWRVMGRFVWVGR